VPCSSCACYGATLACSIAGCASRYHLLCAMRDGCKLDKLLYLSGESCGLFCPSHLGNTAVKNACGATRLQQWTSIFDQPLEAKDSRLSASPEPGEPASPSEGSDPDRGRESSEEDGKAPLSPRSKAAAAAEPRSAYELKDGGSVSIDDRVEARFRHRWYPGVLKKMKGAPGGRVQFGVKCDADKRNRMILWVEESDIRRQIVSIDE